MGVIVETHIAEVQYGTAAVRRHTPLPCLNPLPCSTRGRKQILNTVTIYNSKLYILNAAAKCDKAETEGAPCKTPEGLMEALRRSAASFSVLK